MVLTHHLLIPDWRPHTTNELVGWHWTTVAKRKKEDRDFIAWYAKRLDIPKATGKRRVSLKVTVSGRGRLLDPDSLWKSTLDALVLCGLLRGDSQEWCELGPVVLARGEKRETVIVLEDVP